MNIDRSKAPEGATHFSFGDKSAGKMDAWWRPHPTIAGKYWCWAIGSSSGCGNWQERGFELPSNAVSIMWSGEGLPPVGTVCEWHPNHDGWVQVEILGHNGEETWFRREGHESSEICLRMAFFRPIRTPEQIAAEKRENELNRMVATASALDKGWARKMCAALYDAGYRKQDRE